jgi:hypothetical protein
MRPSGELISMICSWCRGKISATPAIGLSGANTNYGICPRCLADRLARLEISVDRRAS